MHIWLDYLLISRKLHHHRHHYLYLSMNGWVWQCVVIEFCNVNIKAWNASKSPERWGIMSLTAINKINKLKQEGAPFLIVTIMVINFLNLAAINKRFKLYLDLNEEAKKKFSVSLDSQDKFEIEQWKETFISKNQLGSKILITEQNSTILVFIIAIIVCYNAVIMLFFEGIALSFLSMTYHNHTYNRIQISKSGRK